MSTIIIHAGTSKAGSSSIQAWLARTAGKLSRDHGAAVLHIAMDQRADRAFLIPVNDRSRSCDDILGRYYTNRADKGRVIESFRASLSAAAKRHSCVILSCEALAQPFCRQDREFVGMLNSFAQDHRVTVAYYVRPQHTSLESAWRQWGFRSGLSPAAYVSERLFMLRYQETLGWVQQAAPDLDFRVRPFRRDMLRDGSIVEDFKTHFLGHLNLARTQISDVWENKGIPTEIATLLARAPVGLFWHSPHHNNHVLDIMKRLADEMDEPEAKETTQGRNLLHCFCHQYYEPSNLELIQGLQWGADYFIAPPPEPVPFVELSALDSLWRPHASQQEAAFALLALREAVSAIEQRDRRNRRSTRLRRSVQRLLGFGRQ